MYDTYYLSRYLDTKWDVNDSSLIWMFSGWGWLVLQNFMAGATGGPQSTYSNTVDTGYSSYPSQASMYSTTPPPAGPTSATYASHYNTTYGYWFLICQET